MGHAAYENGLFNLYMLILTKCQFSAVHCCLTYFYFAAEQQRT